MLSFKRFYSAILDTQLAKFHMQEDYKCTAYIFISFLYKTAESEHLNFRKGFEQQKY